MSMFINPSSAIRVNGEDLSVSIEATNQKHSCILVIAPFVLGSRNLAFSKNSSGRSDPTDGDLPLHAAP